MVLYINNYKVFFRIIKNDRCLPEHRSLDFAVVNERERLKNQRSPNWINLVGKASEENCPECASNTDRRDRLGEEAAILVRRAEQLIFIAPGEKQ